MCSTVVQSLSSVWIIHQSGLVDGLVILGCKYDLVVLDLYFIDLLIISHLHKSVIIHFFYRPLCDLRYQQTVDQHNRHQSDQIVKDKRFFIRLFYFLHTFSLSQFLNYCSFLLQ